MGSNRCKAMSQLLEGRNLLPWTKTSFDMKMFESVKTNRLSSQKYSIHTSSCARSCPHPAKNLIHKNPSAISRDHFWTTVALVFSNKTVPPGSKQKMQPASSHHRLHCRMVSRLFINKKRIRNTMAVLCRVSLDNKEGAFHFARFIGFERGFELEFFQLMRPQSARWNWNHAWRTRNPCPLLLKR